MERDEGREGWRRDLCRTTSGTESLPCLSQILNEKEEGEKGKLGNRERVQINLKYGENISLS